MTIVSTNNEYVYDEYMSGVSKFDNMLSPYRSKCTSQSGITEIHFKSQVNVK